MANREHPSLRFQRGDVKDFYTAMETYIAQYQEELRITREIVREYPSDETGKDYKIIQEQAQAVADIERVVSQAKAIYREMVEEVQRQAVKCAAAKMRETGNYHLRQIADAVESGNWSELAV